MRSDIGLILLAEDGVVLWANQVAAGLLGYSQSDLLQMALPVVGGGASDSQAPTGPIAEAFGSLLTGETFEAEGNARFPTKDNKRVTVHWKLLLVGSTPGRKEILLSISENAQDSAESPVVLSYRDVFEHAVEGIFRTTVGGQCIEVNPALAKMLGYSSPAELVAAVQDLGTLYLNPNRRSELKQALLNQGFVTDFEAEVYRADGSVLWVSIYARAVLGANLEPLYFEGSAINVTERKQTEAALRRSEEQLRELATRTIQVREEERMNVAREIHDELGQALTLLRIDLTWISKRLGKSVGEDERKPLEEKIGSMEQMIQWTLQTVRRIVSTLRPPLLDESGLKDAIEFHLEDFGRRAAIRYEFEATLRSTIPADSATTVFRIFQELLINIARHANASRIKVHLLESSSRLQLRVHDNGRGISRRDLHDSKSFGLLGMVERAAAIGGELELIGSPRSGTTFTLTIPIVNNGSDTVSAA